MPSVAGEAHQTKSLDEVHPEFIVDERASDTAEEVMSEMERASCHEAVEELPERHRYVLIRRYALDDREPVTLAELGEELRISRERGRQLQREAEHLLKRHVLKMGGVGGD